MALLLNATRKMQDSVVLTSPSYKGRYPQNTRDAIQIAKAHKSGIFQIERTGVRKLYDRCYVFKDINYINKDRNDKIKILEELMDFFKSMSVSFKITIVNQYQDMSQFIDGVFVSKNDNDYPQISSGIREWIDEKKEEARIYDVTRILLLTLTVRSSSYDEARSYFLGMDTEIERVFSAFKSQIVPLNGEQRLEIIDRFFYKENAGAPYSFNEDALYDVIPVSVDTYKDFMVFNKNQYVSVLFARRYDTSIDANKALYTLSNREYPSFITIDYAPVAHNVTKDALKNMFGNNERAIAQEADSKKSNNQAVTGISYSKKKKRQELEHYMDQLDDDSEECIMADLVLTVTAESEDELVRRIEAVQDQAKKVGITLETYNQVQLKAFNTALPTGCRQVKKMRPFLASSLVAMQPFYSKNLVEKGGIFYGRDTTTQQLVFADRKQLASPHGVVIGNTGSGKSMLIKMTEISQVLLSSDDDIQIIDPQNETQAICALYGGKFIDMTPRGRIHINPMEVPESVFRGSPEDRETFISSVAGWANSFTESVMDNIAYTAEHKAFIIDAIQSVYDRVFSSKTLIQPTIKDMRMELLRMEKETEYEVDKRLIHMMTNSLKPFTDGIYDMFAYPSDIDISSERLVAFGLNNISDDIWQPVMTTIMFFLTNRIEFNQELQRATRFIVDECQYVTKSLSTSDILLKAVLTYRKFGGICTMAFQNLARVVMSDDLRDMLANCGYKMFFQQKGSDAIALSKIQHLTDIEYEALSNDAPGRYVMVWNNKVILLDACMSKNNPLYDAFSTNFHEKAAAQKGHKGTGYGS